MSQSHRLMTTEAVQEFVLAGNATVTLVSKQTESRFTYRVRQSEDGKIYFVGLMTGPDNENSFQYLGLIRENKELGLRFEHGKKSKISADALGFKAFDWFFNKALLLGAIPDKLEVWHEGRCGRCHRKLTVPESIERGIGPECINHLH